MAALQDAHLLQSAKHHGQHHVGSKDTHYCVVTNLVNPVLDKLRFWRTLEALVSTLLGVEKREDTSLLERSRGQREQIEAFR